MGLVTDMWLESVAGMKERNDVNSRVYFCPLLPRVLQSPVTHG